MIGNFPAVLNFSRLFLKLNRFISNYLLARGVHSLLYFAYMCVWDLFIGGGIYLAENILR
jgi:hypothetical protein